MGHHRKGEDRGSVDRPGARNARIRRGKKSPLATETRVVSPLVAKSYRSAGRGGPAARSAAPPGRVALRRSAPKPGLPWATGGCGWWRRCSR